MFDAFFEFFTFSQAEQDAIYLSIKIALAAVLYSLPFAIITAWLLARKNFPGKALLDGIIHLPLVLPPVVIGYLLLVSMGKNGIIGKYLLQWFGFSFAFSWEGAALASAVVAFPLMVRSIRLALEGIDFKLEQAAQSHACIFYDYVAAFFPRYFVWLDSRFCPFSRRIWRDCYFRFQYPRRYPYHSAGDVFLY